jgi:hypothetical protein
MSIANGLVALLGQGEDDSQEHVSELLLELSGIPNNRRAIAVSGAIPKLIAQIKSKAPRVQELGAAVLARLTADTRRGSENVAECVAHGGIRPLVALLEAPSAAAKAQALAVVAAITRGSLANQEAVFKSGGIEPLVALLTSANAAVAGDESSGTAPCQSFRSRGAARTDIDSAKATESKPLIGALLVSPTAQAAAALWSLTSSGASSQTAIAGAGAIGPLIRLLGGAASPRSQRQAAGALSGLAAQHPRNQQAIMSANAVEPLVAMLHPVQPVTGEDDLSEAIRLELIGGQANAALALAALACKARGKRAKAN